MLRRLLIIAAGLVVVAVVIVGVLQTGGGSDGDLAPLSAQAVREGVAGAPASLAAVHRQGNELLPGGRKALDARLTTLRGRPVVVNVWGAWCDPCRREFPIFQHVAVERAHSVAFLGVDTQDGRRDASRFLRQVPVPYPSYRDPDGALASSYGLSATPSTIFYDRRGRMTLHQGVYATKADLEADIERYALRA